MTRRTLLTGALGLAGAAGVGGHLWTRRTHRRRRAGEVPSLAYFYRPPADGRLGPIAEEFDHVILTHLDEPARDELVDLGLQVPMLQYLRFEAIMDGTFERTWRNQVAYQDWDWDWISRDHPDWFLLDHSGERIRAGSGDPAEEHFFLMDPAHPGWRGFFVERALEMRRAGAWDGTFLDNVELSLAKRERTGQLPAAYPDDASYRAAVTGLVHHLQDALPGPLEANLIEQRDPWDDTRLELAAHLDIAFWEGWGVGWPGQDLPGRSLWERTLDVTERTQRAGTGVTLVAIGDRDDERRQQLAYASYLLVAGRRAHFRYADASRYDEPWLYSNYDLDLGTPVGARRRDGDGWVREFTKGRVSVNPTTWDVAIG